ncbi:MAG: hypothetical protein AAF969_16245 [Bacteroidota bacterium]
METVFDLKEVLRSGKIQNELDLERALIASRLLRIMAEETPKLPMVRKELRKLIKEYEEANWSRNSKVTQKQIEDNEQAELRAEKERPLIRQYLTENLKHLGQI